MIYRLAGALIVLFWLSMMTWLVIEEILPDLGSPPTAGYRRFLTTLEPEKRRVDRMGIYFGASRLGYTERSYLKLRAGDYQIRSHYELAFGGGSNLLEGMVPGAKAGEPVRMRMRMTALVGPAFQLRCFEIDADMGGIKQRIYGTMQGGELLITVVRNGQKEQQKVPFDSQTVLGGLLAPSEYSGKLKLGHTWDLSFIDPFTGKPKTGRRKVIRRERIEIRGQAHDTFVVETTMDKVVTKAWVDDSGRVMREQRPFGMHLEREEVPTKK